MKTPDRARFRRYLTITVAALLLTVLVFTVVGFAPRLLFAKNDEAGQFGDSFGFVNSLFSALAFAGLVITLLIQISEFHLAQEERVAFIETQKEISDQQYINSLMESVNTWHAINSKMPPPTKDEVDLRHLRHARSRYLNLILLDLVQGFMLMEVFDPNANMTVDGFKADPTYKREAVYTDIIVHVGSRLLFCCDSLIRQCETWPASEEPPSARRWAEQTREIVRNFRKGHSEEIIEVCGEERFHFFSGAESFFTSFLIEAEKPKWKSAKELKLSVKGFRRLLVDLIRQELDLEVQDE